MSTRTTLLACAALAASLTFGATGALAGDKAERSASKAPASKVGIQWFATWEQAKAEAERTGRPILFTSAAPHCRNVSGMW